jgi:hypothetical protein
MLIALMEKILSNKKVGGFYQGITTTVGNSLRKWKKHARNFSGGGNSDHPQVWVSGKRAL